MHVEKFYSGSVVSRSLIFLKVNKNFCNKSRGGRVIKDVEGVLVHPPIGPTLRRTTHIDPKKPKFCACLDLYEATSLPLC